MISLKPGAGGGLGHIATQLAAKGMGMRVVAIDHSSKRDLAMQMGAEHFVGIDTESDVPAAVTKLTDGLGAQACLVLTRESAHAPRTPKMTPSNALTARPGKQHR